MADAQIFNPVVVNIHTATEAGSNLFIDNGIIKVLVDILLQGFNHRFGGNKIGTVEIQTNIGQTVVIINFFRKIGRIRTGRIEQKILRNQVGILWQAVGIVLAFVQGFIHLL